MNSKLFQKSIDLKTNYFIGGGNDITYKYCTQSTVDEEGCTVTTTTTYDDKNRVISECEDITCPD